jgi:hypothetical protein
MLRLNPGEGLVSRSLSNFKQIHLIGFPSQISFQVPVGPRLPRATFYPDRRMGRFGMVIS